MVFLILTTIKLLFSLFSYFVSVITSQLTNFNFDEMNKVSVHLKKH